MNLKHLPLQIPVVLVLLCCAMNAQQPTWPQRSSAVPRLVNFSGKVDAAFGKTVSGSAGATFAIYNDQYEGTALWLETQNIQIDPKGNYTVQLGASKPEGLPLDLFTSGQARWLGVRINGGAERPRILMLSVPYALKAADAETVGGLPPSAFVLAAPPVPSSASAGSAGAAAPPAVTPNLAGTGTQNYLPLWTDSAGTLGNSVMYQAGTGSTAKIGINTTAPATRLDVNGPATVRGTLSLASTGTATSTGGKNSEPIKLTASAFNSGTGTAAAQNFQWQAEPVANDTATASGTINLLYGAGANSLAETGGSSTTKDNSPSPPARRFPGPVRERLRAWGSRPPHRTSP